MLNVKMSHMEQEENEFERQSTVASQIDFARLFHAAPVAMCITTLAGRFIEVNEEFLDRSGYCREEVIGFTSAEIGIWLDYNDRVRIISSLIDKGKLKNEDIYFRDKNNNIFAGLFSAELIEINCEPCIFAFITDITERKHLEEQIEMLNTDLMARKMELEMANGELEAFNYTVSHDLNGPLTIIGGFCHLLREQCGPLLKGEHLDYLKRIQEGTRVMGKLIDSLLCFSRLSRCELRREEVDLSMIAREITDSLRMKTPDHRVICIIADGIRVDGDAIFLQIALENLIGNAWKYSSKKEETFIELGRTESKGRNCYFIRDKGAGFDNMYAETMFSPFKRLHSDREFAGHGIGLATVSRIIQRHGGEIWAEGQVGKGATFYFIL
ncbi:sensor histidine kinase [Geotalea toluenoxydans]